jgi:hypothetical protein
MRPVAEGLSATEVGKEISEHAARAREHGSDRMGRRDTVITIAEAVLLSIVTITAAWSGYSAATWSTESSLNLATASATRTQANRAYQEALTLRTQDAANFNAWFSAYLSGDRRAATVAERRLRPEYLVAFKAWLATQPFTNPQAPRGPQYMPQYRPAGEVRARALDARAEGYYAEGEDAAVTSDEYIRVTVILASVLFIVGIGSHFPLRAARVGLLSVGAALLLFATVEILRLPGTPH